jgi:hypothetical protein
MGPFSSVNTRDPVLQQVVRGELVELADELARLEVEDRVALLELVELLEHGDGHRHVVFLEVVERIKVVEDDRRVEDEDLLLFAGHRGTPGPADTGPAQESG